MTLAQSFKKSFEQALAGEVHDISTLWDTCIDGRPVEEVEAVMEFWKEQGYELRPDGFYKGERYAFSFEDGCKQMEIGEVPF